MCDADRATAVSWSRRRLLTLAAAGAVAGAAETIRAGAPAALASAPSERPGGQPTAEEALRLLMEGNERFAANTPRHRITPDWEALAQGQAPIAVILGCSDSRAPPELVFDQGPGDLFVVRVAGNFVTDYGLASVEYAVALLNVPLVMVMGHSNCGAVGAAIEVVQEGTDLPGELDHLVARITPVVRRVQEAGTDDLLGTSIEENVRENVRLLETVGELLPQRVADGRLRIVGAIDDLGSAHVRLL